MTAKYVDLDYTLASAHEIFRASWSTNSAEIFTYIPLGAVLQHDGLPADVGPEVEVPADVAPDQVGDAQAELAELLLLAGLAGCLLLELREQRLESGQRAALLNVD